MSRGWQTRSIADICEIKPPKNEVRRRLRDSDHVSFVPMEDLGINQKFLQPRSEREFGQVTGSYTYFADGDVLLAKITPCFENGKLGIARGLTNGVGFGSSEYIVFRPQADLLSEYLYYFLLQESFRAEGIKSMGGAVGHRRVSKNFVERTQIPLPRLLEQQRIVTILDEAFAKLATATTNAERNLKNAGELFESRLSTAFMRQEWITRTLGEVCVVERGSSPRPIKNYITDDADGVNWIKIGDTKGVSKYIETSRQKITKEGAAHSRRVNPGDFILSNSMSFGRPYIMATMGYIHDGWFVLRLKEDVDADYFYCLLASNAVQGQFRKLAAGAIVLNISSDLVKKAVLPMPPLSEQKRLAKEIVVYSAETARLQAIYNQKLNRISDLKQSLLQKAFSGELTSPPSSAIKEAAE